MLGTLLPPKKLRTYSTALENIIAPKLREHLYQHGVNPDCWTRCTRKPARTTGSRCGHVLNDSVKFVFQTNAWLRANFQVRMLHKVYRQQTDLEWIHMLNRLRVGDMDSSLQSALHGLHRPLQVDNGVEPTKLYVSRSEVDTENQRKFAKLQSPVVDYSAIDSTRIERILKAVDSVGASCTAPSYEQGADGKQSMETQCLTDKDLQEHSKCT